MKRYSIKHFHHQNTSLASVTISVIFFSTVYLFGALQTSNLNDKDYLTLISGRYKKIKDPFAYEFLSAIRKNESLAEPFNLYHLSLKTDQNMISFISSIESLTLNAESKKELISNAFNDTGIWYCGIMEGVMCLNRREIERTLDQNNLGNEWKEFHKKYGAAYHQFSVPVHDKKMQFVVIQHQVHCGTLCAEEEFILFKKIDGNWTKVRKRSLWVS